MSLQGHSNEKLIGATNSNNFFNIHMPVINAEQLPIQETSCGEYIKILEVLSVAVCDQNKPNTSSPLLEEGSSIFSMYKLRNSPHFK